MWPIRPLRVENNVSGPLYLLQRAALATYSGASNLLRFVELG